MPELPPFHGDNSAPQPHFNIPTTRLAGRSGNPDQPPARKSGSLTRPIGVDMWKLAPWGIYSLSLPWLHKGFCLGKRRLGRHEALINLLEHYLAGHCV